MASRLRILHCMRAPVGGLFRHVRDLSRAQAEAGHDVGVVCDSVSGDRLTEDRLTALQSHLALGLHRFPMAREIGWQDRLSYLAIKTMAERLAPDVLHGHGAKGGAFGRLTAQHLNSRGRLTAAFYTPHGGSLHYAPNTLKGRIFAALERHLLTVTDGLIFESQYAARTFATNIEATRGSRRVIYNGLLDAEFATITPDRDAAEFLFIGELSPIKGVDVLLRALEIVSGTTPARLQIVGDGKCAGDLKQLTAQLGLAAAVTFSGALPLRDALRMGRCVVMPSRAESLPYVALETTAAGVPLIASDVGGIPEIVAGSRTWLVPPGDEQALAAAMQRALDDPPSAVNCALLLRSALRTRFTVDAMSRSVNEFYVSALERRAAA